MIGQLFMMCTPPPIERSFKKGFTLIELAIVLAVIGLVIGGVLVGQDLIKAAAVRAQISQIEKYNSAVNAFYGKYLVLPGDMTKTQAATLGFLIGGQNRVGTQGQGDGNGIIQGYAPGLGSWLDWSLLGEPMMFWEDLSSANMIDGNFNSYNPTSTPNIGAGYALADLYIPVAKIGNGNYVVVTSGGLDANTYYGFPGNGLNYFNILVPALINGGGTCQTCNAGLTVSQAYNIDKKTDDGLPTTGTIQAMFLGSNFAIYGGPEEWATNALSASSATCFDTTSNQYSMGQNGGANINCGLSFKMQGGAR